MTIEELHADMNRRFDELDEALSSHVDDDKETFDKHRDMIEDVKRKLAYIAGGGAAAIFIIEPLLKRVFGG